MGNPIFTHAFLALSLVIIFTVSHIIQHRKFTKKYSNSNILDAIAEKELLNQLFNNATDLIFYKDANSRFKMSNKYNADIIGVKDPKELIGKTDFDFYEKEIAQKFYDDEQEIIKSKKPIIAKIETNVNKDGVERVFSITKIPVYNKKTKTTELIGIGRDISNTVIANKEIEQQTKILKETNSLLEERQEEIQQMAEELRAQSENLKTVNAQLEKLSFVASNTGNIVVIMDGNGNFEWANNEFEKNYGMTLDEFSDLRGNNLRDNSANTNISAILNQVYLSKKSYTYNAVSIDYEGNEKWFQSNLSPILDSNDEIQNLVLIDTDITDLKFAEQQIQNQKSEIESRTEALKITNATKDRLFSIIAHDLKNPFHSIMGFSDLLQKKHNDLAPDKMKEYLAMINTSTKSAYDLLENLLEWARTQTDNVQFNPEIVSVKECVENVISLLSIHATNKNLILSNEIIPELKVFADKNMLRTIIRNITGNAIKYTKEKGFITFAGYTDEHSTIIEIVDTGIGMPAVKTKELFDLDKISSTAGTSGETGTGLGLIVCHEFMQKNGGSISVNSELGRGTRFKLSFPLKS